MSIDLIDSIKDNIYVERQEYLTANKLLRLSNYLM